MHPRPPAPTPRTPHRAARLALWLLAAPWLAVTAGGADPPPAAITLFDGKTLDGWKRTDFYKPGEVKVVDGAIVLARGNPMTGVTCTRKGLPTTDYELTYEARRLAGDDFFAAATFPVGNSFITFVNGGWSGNISGLSSLDGMDASENETTQSYRFLDGRWYAFRIHVTGTTIRCSVDGKELVAVRHRGREVRTRIEVRGSEPLGFAAWETSGAVRNVAIRPLTPAEVRQAEKSDDDEEDEPKGARP